MKVNVAGIKRISGTAKVSGKPFEMCTLFILAAIEPSSSEKVQISGFGYEPLEMPVSPEALKQFEHIKFPSSVEIVMDTQARYGKFESVCIGVVATPPQSKAA